MRKSNVKFAALLLAGAATASLAFSAQAQEVKLPWACRAGRVLPR